MRQTIQGYEKQADDLKRQREERYAQQVEVCRREFSDYDAVVTSATVPAYIRSELFAIENGARMAYLLGKTPALCQQLDDLKPDAALRKFRFISRFVELKDMERRTQAQSAADVANWYSQAGR